jgi:hypothetical protein
VFETLDDFKTSTTPMALQGDASKDQTMLDELMKILEEDPQTVEVLTGVDPFPGGGNTFLGNSAQLMSQLQPQIPLPSAGQQSVFVSSAGNFLIPQTTTTSNAFGASKLREALMSAPSNSSTSLSSTSSQPGSPLVGPGYEAIDCNNERSKCGVAKRRQKPMKDIGPIMPPQLGASGSASLWEFILELLADAPAYGQFIRWKDREHGTFKIYDSQVVAALWGKHKNRTNMNFDKMSRAMRYYYGKNILEKGPDGGRLEYEFRPGSQWLRYVSRNLNSHSFVAPNPNQFSEEEGKGQGSRVTRRRPSGRHMARSTSPY